MNNIYFIIGASGSGKSTIENGFLNTFANNYGKFDHIVSYATRAKRPGEVDGEDYYFISDEEFNQMDRNNEFIQKIEHAGSKKGTTIGEWKSKLEQGHVMLPILLDSVLQLKETLPQVIPGIENHMYIIFINISEDEVFNRLITRYANEKGIDPNELAEMFNSFNNNELQVEDQELISMFNEINLRLDDIAMLSKTTRYANYILDVDGKTPEQTIDEFNNIIADTVKRS